MIPIFFSILSYQMKIISQVKFSSLIKLDDGVWDEDLVMNLFDKIYAYLICGIPLGRSGHCDWWFLLCERRGLDSISGVYEFRRHSIGGVSSPIWKLIWSLKVPPKLKFLLWKDYMNILPTCDNLNKKTCVGG